VGNQKVSKGPFKEVNIRGVCKNIQDADINIISNYIFEFPEDDMETMRGGSRVECQNGKCLFLYGLTRQSCVS
jgi:hypothetical protein